MASSVSVFMAKIEQSCSLASGLLGKERFWIVTTKRGEKGFDSFIELRHVCCRRSLSGAARFGVPPVASCMYAVSTCS